MKYRVRRTQVTRTIAACALGVAALIPMSLGASASTPKPAPVSKVKVTASESAVALSWTNPKAGTFSGVMIRRSLGAIAPATSTSGTLVATVSFKSTSHTDKPVAADTKYSYSLFTFKGKIFSTAIKKTVITAGKPLSGVNILSGSAFGFNGFAKMISADSAVWVVNQMGNSVTEVDAITGTPTTVVKSPNCHFSSPEGIAFDGANLWVTNYDGDSVTEINAATATCVKVINASSYEFKDPSGITVGGKDVWVANQQGGVTEFVAATGALVRALTSNSYQFSEPVAIVDDGANVWVANFNESDLTEVNASTGAFDKVLTGTSCGFDYPISLVVASHTLWVANQGGLVTEVDTTSGSCTQQFFGSPFNFDHPSAVAYDGTELWVTDTGSSTVIEMNAATGAWVTNYPGVSSAYELADPVAIAAADGKIFVANYTSNALTEFPG